MKLISLNIWGGKAHSALVNFLEKEKADTDIFCLQEVWTSPRSDITESNGTRVHILEEVKELLADFVPYFFPVQDWYDLNGKVDFEITVGQAIFVRKGITVSSIGNQFVYLSHNGAFGDDWVHFPASFSYARIETDTGPLTVVNFHGKAFPADKLDTPERIDASQKILDFVKGETGEVIVCGDFNLFPETKSIALLEADLENLIQTYDIKTTRSKASPYHGTPEQQNFADYTFVSKGITAKKFSVPEDCIASDHLPMILEF